MPDTTIPPPHGSYRMPSLGLVTVGDAMHEGILSRESETLITEVARSRAAPRDELRMRNERRAQVAVLIEARRIAACGPIARKPRRITDAQRRTVG